MAKVTGVAELGGQPRSVRVIDVDHRVLRRGREQTALGGEVVLHRLVEVEMVLGQIGEDRRREMDRIGAVELEGVGRDLHGTRHVARGQHRRERLLEIDGFRRCPLHVVLDAADHALDRAQEPGRPAGGLEQRPDQERRRGLAVRAGDSDGLEASRGVAVEPRRRRGHSRADAGDPDLGDAQSQWALDHERRGTPGDRLPGVVVAVAGEARNTEEQRPGRDGAVVVGEGCDLGVVDVRGTVGSPGRGARNHLVEPHRGPSVVAGSARNPGGVHEPEPSGKAPITPNSWRIRGRDRPARGSRSLDPRARRPSLPRR